MTESLHCFHGIGLRLTTDSSAIASAAETFLRAFRRETLVGPDEIECVLKEVSNPAEIPVTISSSAQLLSSPADETSRDLLRADWDVFYDHDRMIVDFPGRGRLLLDHRRGRIEGYLVQPNAMHVGVLFSVIHFGLTEILKSRGLYTIHATALEKWGNGILIPGFSGRGKTTCCLALLRAGYRFLSDDHPLVRENGNGLELLSFPVKIDVTAETIEFFPELREAKDTLYPGARKRYFYVEDFYPQSPAQTATPALMIFPQIIDWPTSYLASLPKSRALEQVLPQGLLVFDREIARKEFQVLSRLIEQVSCYQLYFGEDVLDLPRLVDPLLDAAGAQARRMAMIET